MKIYFDEFEEPKRPILTLATPNKKPIFPLIGIEDSTFSMTPNLNNTWTISFDLNQYILNDDGKEIENRCYNLIDKLMRIHVDGIGWFICDHPTESNDGDKNVKTISAESEEIEMQQHDIIGLKINCGTTDSYEMLVEGNVEKIDGVEFAKEQIKFCNKENKELSLLHILLKVSDMHDWDIGYIDTIPKQYKSYENGKIQITSTLLSDEIGTFDIQKQDLYSFLTQDVSQFFNCIFVFDFKNLLINVYHPENLGNNTNINIGFRNIQDSNNVEISGDNFFTRYTVYGSNSLGIEYVNFGTNRIENLTYFLSEKYMSASLITKYKTWYDDVEVIRPLYIEETKKYNEQQKVIDELINRLPLDDCSTDWSTFPDDKLQAALLAYKEQKKGYESLYVDQDGNFDQAALDASPDANDYYQIKDVIIPSIEIEIENRKLKPEQEKNEYIDSYKTNWKLYGLDELEIKLEGYRTDKKICEDGGYNVPWTEESEHTKDYHDKMYQKYLEAVKQLDASQSDSCAKAYETRKKEVEDATSVQETYNTKRKEYAKQADKETWEKNGLSFTQEDLSELSKFYIDTDYTNENMFLTNSDDAVSAIDEQLKLLSVAQDDLFSASQPQYIYKTTLDNFLASYDYKNYTDNLNMGDFWYLGVRDDFVVKLRVVSITYNPLVMDNNISIEFSNMVTTKDGRNDFSYLLNSPSGRGKNSASGGSGDFLSNEGITLTAGMIQKLVSSAALANKINQIINSNIGNIIGSGGSISLGELNAKMIKVIDLFAENGFFEYLQAKLISVDKIVAGSGDFKNLSALVAQIDNLLAGNISGELGHLIELTAENATIDEALIRRVIAMYITVNDLKAGTITTDKFGITSNDGKFQIIGNTLTIYNNENVPVLQLGQDKNGNYGLVISDGKGGILLDSQGLHAGIVPNDFIKTEMIADGAVTENKIDKTNIRDWTDDSGNKVFDVSKLYYGNDKFEISYNSIKENISELQNKIKSLSLNGEQIFVEKNDVISPASITVSAIVKNGATVKSWYIDNTLNTSDVSSDNMSITIPSSYMKNRTLITIKACSDNESIYDVFTLYKITNSNSVTSYIISSKGDILTDIDNDSDTTILKCVIFDGNKEIKANWYKWLLKKDGSDKWEDIGSTETVTVSKNDFKEKITVKCQFDV